MIKLLKNARTGQYLKGFFKGEMGFAEAEWTDDVKQAHKFLNEGIANRMAVRANLASGDPVETVAVRDNVVGALLA